MTFALFFPLLLPPLSSSVQRDYVETINASSETLLAIVNDILDFSMIEADKLVLQNTAFNLQKVIESATNIAGLRAGQKGIQLVYKICPGTPLHIVSEPNRLQQVSLLFLFYNNNRRGNGLF